MSSVLHAADVLVQASLVVTALRRPKADKTLQLVLFQWRKVGHGWTTTIVHCKEILQAARTPLLFFLFTLLLSDYTYGHRLSWDCHECTRRRSRIRMMIQSKSTNSHDMPQCVTIKRSPNKHNKDQQHNCITRTRAWTQRFRKQLDSSAQMTQNVLVIQVLNQADLEVLSVASGWQCENPAYRITTCILDHCSGPKKASCWLLPADLSNLILYAELTSHSQYKSIMKHTWNIQSPAKQHELHSKK